VKGKPLARSGKKDDIFATEDARNLIRIKREKALAENIEEIIERKKKSFLANWHTGSTQSRDRIHS
jgi:hypothetical protein